MNYMTKVETKDVVEAMELGDHNYTVGMVPLTLPDGKTVWDRQAVVRKDTGQYLGTVGKDYATVQPVALYEMTNALLDSTGGYIDGVINMHGGSVFGVSIHIERQEYLPGDPVDLNFLMLASHNGMYGILGRALTTRFFCLNQVPSSTKLFNLKHTRYVANRLDTATKMLSYYHKEVEGFNENMKVLTSAKMPEKRMVEWFRGLHPKPNKDSKRANSILDNNVATYVNLLKSGRGVDVPGFRGTGWAAFNALTEYVNHERSTRIKNDRDPAEVKFESVAFGDGSNLMHRGLTSLLDVIKTEPTAPIMVR